MNSRIVVTAILLLPALSGLSQAQSLPDWSISKICQQDSAPGQCRLFEQRARARVAEAWLTLPSSIQKGCATEFRPPLEPSWRIMADCIGELGVVTRVNVRKSAVEREKQVVAVLHQRRQQAQKTARRKAERAEADKQAKLVEAAENQRVARAEESFLAFLGAERAREQQQKIASRKRAQEIEDQRLAVEEASFLKELAALQKRERLAKAQAAKTETQGGSGTSKLTKSTGSNPQTASASAAGLISGSKPGPLLKLEKQPQQKTIKVTLPAQPATKAIAKPAAKKTSAKPRTTEVAICEDRLKETAQAGSVLFAFDSADLLEETELTLRALSAAVRACGRLKVTIEGHTDATGRITYNQDLSERRAQNVANYLLNTGVKSGQVSYIGYGEKRPVASNRTTSGRARNRRIEYRAQ